MVVISGGGKVLSLGLGEHLSVSAVLLWDWIVVLILIGLDGPILSKIGAVNDYFVPIFPFVGPG